MFRYERPQKGRFRQFYQIGVEAFGAAEPKLDAEIISMLKLFLERLQMKELKFEVNSIGCEKCRPDYKKALLDFFLPRLQTSARTATEDTLITLCEFLTAKAVHALN